MPRSSLVAHGVAAVLDDDGRAGVAAHVGQRLATASRALLAAVRRRLACRDHGASLMRGGTLARRLLRRRRRPARPRSAAQRARCRAAASRALVQVDLADGAAGMRRRAGAASVRRRCRAARRGSSSSVLVSTDLVGHRRLVEQLHHRRSDSLMPRRASISSSTRRRLRAAAQVGSTSPVQPATSLLRGLRRSRSRAGRPASAGRRDRRN